MPYGATQFGKAELNEGGKIESVADGSVISITRGVLCNGSPNAPGELAACTEAIVAAVGGWCDEPGSPHRPAQRS